MEVNAGLFTGSYKENEFLIISSHRDILEETSEEVQTVGKGKCQICADDVGLGANGEVFVACNECGFPVCKTCYDYERSEGNQVCPQCKTRYKRLRGCARVPGDEDEDNVDDIEYEFNLMVISEFLPEQKAILPAYAVSSSCSDLVPSQPRALDPSKDLAAYGYGSIAWKERMENWKQKHEKDLSAVKRENDSDDLDDGDQESDKDLLMMDVGRLPLSRKLPIRSSQISPYRMVIIIRLIVTGFFFHYRITNPVKDAYALWTVSVICEIWFAIMWLLDQLPKWRPVDRETYLDRLALRYEKAGEGCELPAVDIFVSTADTSRELPLITANTVLSILALDYPPEKVTCYVSDDGADMLTFEALSETSEFARKWVPFCKRFNIEPRAPEYYFAKKVDYLKDKMIFPEFIKERRYIKREYEEFKVRMNGLVAKAQKVPEGGWTMQDGTPWPGNNLADHPGMIQVFLGQREGQHDTDGNALPPLIYVSREKKPGYNHHKKAGAMNALVRVSAVLTNAPYLLNMDCNMFISSSKALRESMCFLMDSSTGKKACFVQFSRRSYGVDGHDQCANMSIVFHNIIMKGLDGIQGPTYTGSGCVVRRKALYGFDAPKSQASSRAWRCWPKWCCFWRSARKGNKIKSHDTSEDIEAYKHDSATMVLEQNLEKRLGMSQVLAASIFAEDGGRVLANVDHLSLLNEAIHVISCGYEDKTDWGKEVGWIYGPDILTSFRLHCRGWRSIFCDPPIPAFRWPAPITLSNHLQQVMNSALGSVEISLSRNSPIWYGYRGGLKLLERLAYINAVVYPFASFPLVAYCSLPAVCLISGQFIIPELSNIGSIWFVSLFICIFTTNILEMKWSGLGMEDWWRNEQYWVIEGVSSNLFAVFQGLLQVVSGIEANSSALPVAALLIPPTTLLILNLIGVVAGTSSAIQNGNGSWAPLFGKLFFAFWVIVHLYPLLKGPLGRNNRTPTIVLVWSVMIASIFSLLWVRVNPFLARQDGPVLVECGLDCK